MENSTPSYKLSGQRLKNGVGSTICVLGRSLRHHRSPGSSIYFILPNERISCPILIFSYLEYSLLDMKQKSSPIR